MRFVDCTNSDQACIERDARVSDTVITVTLPKRMRFTTSQGLCFLFASYVGFVKVVALITP